MSITLLSDSNSGQHPTNANPRKVFSMGGVEAESNETHVLISATYGYTPGADTTLVSMWIARGDAADAPVVSAVSTVGVNPAGILPVALTCVAVDAPGETGEREYCVVVQATNASATGSGGACSMTLLVNNPED